MCLIGPVGVTFMLYINHCIGRNFHTDAGKEVEKKEIQTKFQKWLKANLKGSIRATCTHNKLTDAK